MTSSTTDRAARVALVAEWLIAGMSPSQVPAQAAKAEWSALAAGELLDLVTEAQAFILADANVSMELENAKAIDRLNGLYAKSLAIQDYKACLQIQKELNATLARVTNPMLAGRAKTPPAKEPTIRPGKPDGRPRTQARPDRP